jgi:hypothetical protein
VNVPQTPQTRRFVSRAAAAVLLLGALAGELLAAEAAATAPQDVLRALLADPATTDATLAALAAAGDKELLPVFAAAARTGDRARRMLAVSAAAKLAGADAADILQDRLARDDDALVRSESLVQLIELKAISDEQLTQLLWASDPMVRCLAARALARHGHAGAPVLDTLRTLAGSSDTMIACLSRLTLLSTGDLEQLAPLAAAMRNPDVPERLLSMLLGQIADDRIAPAAEVARELAAFADEIPLKVRAYRAAALAGPNGAAMLAQTIADSSQTVLRVQLLHILADLPDAQPHLETLSHGQDAVALLARLELLRAAGGEPAAQAATAAVAVGHAVVVDYCLDRARDDLTARGAAAAFYVPALIAIIHAAPADAPYMLDEHTQAAQAAQLLAEFAPDQAAPTLTAILSGPYDGRVRAVAAGMLRCRNRAVCDWMAPLLTSPYEELASDAALALGQHADPRATKVLGDILRAAQRHPPEMTALAAWYLARITARTPAAVAAAVEAIQNPAPSP